MQIPIPFCGSAYKSESLIISSQECINFYPRPYPELGENKMALFGTPGLELWVSLVEKEIRAFIAVGGYLGVVVGDRLKKVSTTGIVTDIGDVSLLPSSGQVGIATNGLDVVIVGGSIGYVYDLTTETLSQIVDSDFPGGNSIIQIDGYYLVNKPGTGQIWRSDWNNGSSWDGLAFSTAGGNPDNVVSIILDNRDVWVIGEYTTEIWYNTGAATFNFARIEGAFIDQGGVTPNAKTKINNAVYWLGQDQAGQDQVFQATGRQPKIISTIPISNMISGCDKSNAFMFSYQQLGHNFVVLTFPLSDITIVYDSTIGMWHQRSSMIKGVNRRWRANCHALFNGDHIVGDFVNGKLYKLKTDVYDEDGDQMVAIRTTPVIRSKQNRITVDQVQVFNEPGVGLITGEVEDTDPQAMFSWSKDGGRNFSAEVDMPLGKIGETENVSKVWQLGQGKNWVFRYKISAAVKRVILGAIMETEENDV